MGRIERHLCRSGAVLFKWMACGSSVAFIDGPLRVAHIAQLGSHLIKFRQMEGESFWHARTRPTGGTKVSVLDSKEWALYYFSSLKFREASRITLRSNDRIINNSKKTGLTPQAGTSSKKNSHHSSDNLNMHTCSSSLTRAER